MARTARECAATTRQPDLSYIRRWKRQKGRQWCNCRSPGGAVLIFWSIALSVRRYRQTNHSVAVPLRKASLSLSLLPAAPRPSQAPSRPAAITTRRETARSRHGGPGKEGRRRFRSCAPTRSVRVAHSGMTSDKTD